MAKEDKEKQVHSKLYPVEIVKINGVPIEVRPLRWGRVVEAIDFFWELAEMAEGGKLTRDYLRESAETLNCYLDECVHIPDAPNWTVEDLPPGVLPEIIETFIEQTLAPGNWGSLARKLRERFGLAIMTNLSQGMSPS